MHGSLSLVCDNIHVLIDPSDMHDREKTETRCQYFTICKLVGWFIHVVLHVQYQWRYFAETESKVFYET